MNTLDQEKIDAAMGLISNVDGGMWNHGSGPGGNQSAEWCDAARTWLASYGRPVSPWPKDHQQPAVVPSRWRTIDPAGNVATEPTPEPPDESDEGETGPPEQALS